MSARTWYRTATVFGVAALVCLVASYLVWRDSGITGAYFDRSIEAPTYAGLFVTSGHPGLADALLGGAIAFAIAALVVALVARQSGRRRID